MALNRAPLNARVLAIFVSFVMLFVSSCLSLQHKGTKEDTKNTKKNPRTAVHTIVRRPS